MLRITSNACSVVRLGRPAAELCVREQFICLSSVVTSVFDDKVMHPTLSTLNTS